MDNELAEDRFQLHDDRLDHLTERIVHLEARAEGRKEAQAEDKKEAHHRRIALWLEIIVVVVVSVETVFTGLIYLHHG